jgi:hypothetical protein
MEEYVRVSSERLAALREAHRLGVILHCISEYLCLRNVPLGRGLWAGERPEEAEYLDFENVENGGMRTPDLNAMPSPQAIRDLVENVLRLDRRKTELSTQLKEFHVLLRD